MEWLKGVFDVANLPSVVSVLLVILTFFFVMMYHMGQLMVSRREEVTIFKMYTSEDTAHYLHTYHITPDKTTPQ